MSTALALEVVVIGRVCIDLYPQQANVPLAEVESFSKSIGGTAANLAVAVAKHGHRVALVTKTGDDAFGAYAQGELARLGVDNRWISTAEGSNSVLTFCEMYPPDDPPLHIFRSPTAPDMFLTVDDIPLPEIRDAKVLVVTATGMSREPSREAHLAALAARGRSNHTVLDLDYRPMFWDSETQATTGVAELLPYGTIAVGNVEECRVAVGETDPERAADALLDRGVEVAIVKMGGRGVLMRTASESLTAEPLTIDVVNGLGSGDAFAGALCHGLLEGWDLARTLWFANAAGALVATKYECSPAMPTTHGSSEAFIADTEVARWLQS